MKRVVFDCDNTMGLPGKEIDDGLTLLYLLGRPDIELLGITTTFGNGSTEQAYQQTKELLRRAGRSDIPLWKGQAAPGDEPNQATEFLAQTAAKYPDEVSLLAAGPLTNLLAAIRADSRFLNNLSQIACMGGYLAPLRIGWRDLSELNLSADPNASHLVLNGPCPLTLMSAQLCLQAPFDWDDMKKIRHLHPWLRKTVRNWLLAFGGYFAVGRFYLWDLVPAVYLSFPDLFEAQRVEITSSQSDLSSGKLLVKNDGHTRRQITLPAKIVDPRQFLSIVIEGWGKAQFV